MCKFYRARPVLESLLIKLQSWHLFWRISANDYFCTALTPLTATYPFYFIFSTLFLIITATTVNIYNVCFWFKFRRLQKFKSEAVNLNRRCSVQKVFLEISQDSQENNCAKVSFLIKLQAFFHRTPLLAASILLNLVSHFHWSHFHRCYFLFACFFFCLAQFCFTFSCHYS